jgi:hypothetical protein
MRWMISITRDLWVQISRDRGGQKWFLLHGKMMGKFICKRFQYFSKLLDHLIKYVMTGGMSEVYSIQPCVIGCDHEFSLHILPNNSFKPINNTAWDRTRLCTLQKKGALDSHPQVIKFTSCFPIVGCSLRVLRLLPPLKLFAKI